MAAMNAPMLHVCGGKLSNSSSLDLHRRADGSEAGPFQKPHLKARLFRFCQCARIDDARRCYLLVACEETRQPLQFFAVLAENSANGLGIQTLRRTCARSTHREWIPL